MINLIFRKVALFKSGKKANNENIYSTVFRKSTTLPKYAFKVF